VALRDLPDTVGTVYRGPLLEVRAERLALPDGRESAFDVVRHPGGAVATAVDDAGGVCLIRQYRAVLGRWLWELPAGKRDAGEDPALTARRELEEEAGLRAGRWDRLGTLVTAPGFCDEELHLYLARDLTPVPRRPEDHEHIEVHWLPLAKALAMVRDGTVVDAKTVAALCHCRFMLEA
jgi:ADP-ribose pyrophosphatase